MKAKENICSLWLHFSSLAFKRVFLPLDRKMPQEHQPTHYPQHIFSTSGFWKSTNVELEMSTVKMAQQAWSLSCHSTASASWRVAARSAVAQPGAQILTFPLKLANSSGGYWLQLIEALQFIKPLAQKS